MTARLTLRGQKIRAQRKGLGVSATALAESAGRSRLTICRTEHGEAPVAMGAYLNALAALGLDLTVLEARIVLAAPMPTDQVRGVAALTALDI